ncbi:hypothetical protein Baya_9051 [Bagarius yarrelli]|uniref:Uncharacterized protein n=1 Tax=Bagarius yarrelli TaxID=175774 RepID=A0A556U7A0_BAGYA|nr:hypothetical protein Baya_9051 [Bagarius yarrelli]
MALVTVQRSPTPSTTSSPCVSDLARIKDTIAPGCQPRDFVSSDMFSANKPEV